MILDTLAYLVLALLGGGTCYAVWDSPFIRFVVALVGTILVTLWAASRVLT